MIEEKAVAEKLFTKHRELDLDIDLIERGYKIKTKGKIVWSYGILDMNRLPIETRYRLGVSFSDLYDQEKGILSSYIEEQRSKGDS